MISLYLGAENIAMTQPQKDNFRETLRVIGPPVHPQPAELMHWRPRLDGNATLMRAQFQDGDMTVAGLRQLLATSLGVPVAQITSANSNVTYKTTPSLIITMSLNGVPQMRYILFAGGRASIQQSNDEAVAYLIANAAAWGDV
jgi:hypothetical protein